MDITSGNVTTYVPYIMVDSTDHITRLTGLNAFTVRRGRNGGNFAAMDTPTIIEDADDPGIYWLLLDENTTIDSGFDEQAMVVTMSHAGADPVSHLIRLKRAKITVGTTVASADVTTIKDGVANVQTRVPDALDNGFVKASTKRVGTVTLNPAGTGGQKFGA